jgi:hypothetical protein
MPFCHNRRSSVSKVFPLEEAESQEKKKHVEQLHKDKRKKKSIKEFIKNKWPLNPTHIILKRKNNQRLGQPKEQF